MMIISKFYVINIFIRSYFPNNMIYFVNVTRLFFDVHIKNQLAHTLYNKGTCSFNSSNVPLHWMFYVQFSIIQISSVFKKKKNIMGPISNTRIAIYNSF